MHEVNILERLLNKVDKMSDDLAKLMTEVSGINTRLDKLNGSVASHETRINEMQTQDKIDVMQIETILDKMKEHNINNQTLLKIAAVIGAVVLAILKGGAPVIDELMKLVSGQ